MDPGSAGHLAAIRNRWALTTPTPWFDDGYRIHAPTDDEDKRAGRVIFDYKHVLEPNYPDYAALAKAPEDIAFLLALIEELRSR